MAIHLIKAITAEVEIAQYQRSQQSNEWQHTALTAHAIETDFVEGEMA